MRQGLKPADAAQMLKYPFCGQPLPVHGSFGTGRRGTLRLSIRKQSWNLTWTQNSRPDQEAQSAEAQVSDEFQGAAKVWEIKWGDGGALDNDSQQSLDVTFPQIDHHSLTTTGHKAGCSMGPWGSYFLPERE